MHSLQFWWGILLKDVGYLIVCHDVQRYQGEGTSLPWLSFCVLKIFIKPIFFLFKQISTKFLCIPVCILCNFGEVSSFKTARDLSYCLPRCAAVSGRGSRLARASGPSGLHTQVHSVFLIRFRIQIHRIHIFLGLPNSDPYPLVRGSGSSSKNIVRKTLIPAVLWLLLDFLSLKSDVDVPSKNNKQESFFKKLDFRWRLEGQWRK